MLVCDHETPAERGKLSCLELSGAGPPRLPSSAAPAVVNLNPLLLPLHLPPGCALLQQLAGFEVEVEAPHIRMCMLATDKKKWHRTNQTPQGCKDCEHTHLHINKCQMQAVVLQGNYLFCFTLSIISTILFTSSLVSCILHLKGGGLGLITLTNTSVESLFHVWWG